MAPSVDQLDQPAWFGIGLNVIDLFSAHVSAEYYRSGSVAARITSISAIVLSPRIFTRLRVRSQL